MAGAALGQDRTASLTTEARGRPAALHWRSRTYRVTDAPTLLEESLDGALTHPLPIHGWRFQGTSVDDGETMVFDVLACGSDWHVVKIYR